MRCGVHFRHQDFFLVDIYHCNYGKLRFVTVKYGIFVVVTFWSGRLYIFYEITRYSANVYVEMVPMLQVKQLVKICQVYPN